LPEFRNNLLAGKSGIGISGRLEEAPVQLAAEVERGEEAKLNEWAGAVMAEAVEQAGWDGRKGEATALGSAIGWNWPEKPGGAGEGLGSVADGLADRAAFSATFDSYSACAASLQLVEQGHRLIASGAVDRVVLVTADSRVNHAAVVGYDRLHALTKDFHDCPKAASRPFDRRRSGFVVGEGAAAMVLEAEEIALREKSRIRGEILGAASTADGGSPVAPAMDGEAAARAVRQAMKNAGVAVGKIDYVNAHGTSTGLNDRIEAMVLRKVFGRELDGIPVGSFKSMLGHSAMACGMIELIGALLVAGGSKIPANRNLDEPDVDLWVRGWEEEERKVETILKTSFGFGGQNTAVVARAAIGL
jgi:3-oxoacyl-[acyl-carrier-protein] synthase II